MVDPLVADIYCVLASMSLVINSISRSVPMLMALPGFNPPPVEMISFKLNVKPTLY